eukprot:CAMPEP_0115007992 /NCGR_PEP_ID=MMETSP0216-20121206/21602_1 /TAXON_ID=223996 /ORGANISM="Protocruzia adherens, Strain Boccale" /LENGTH=1502 /DNA_ID=CAMNT_0002375225 /DNA_START=520 /DNA_END=5028 /DNA_ORIENTATION=+
MTTLEDEDHNMETSTGSQGQNFGGVHKFGSSGGSSQNLKLRDNDKSRIGYRFVTTGQILQDICIDYDDEKFTIIFVTATRVIHKAAFTKGRCLIDNLDYLSSTVFTSKNEVTSCTYLHTYFNRKLMSLASSQSSQQDNSERQVMALGTNQGNVILVPLTNRIHKQFNIEYGNEEIIETLDSKNAGIKKLFGGLFRDAKSQNIIKLTYFPQTSVLLAVKLNQIVEFWCLKRHSCIGIYNHQALEGGKSSKFVRETTDQEDGTALDTSNSNQSPNTSLINVSTTSEDNTSATNTNSQQASTKPQMKVPFAKHFARSLVPTVNVDKSKKVLFDGCYIGSESTDKAVADKYLITLAWSDDQSDFWQVAVVEVTILAGQNGNSDVAFESIWRYNCQEHEELIQIRQIDTSVWMLLRNTKLSHNVVKTLNPLNLDSSYQEHAFLLDDLYRECAAGDDELRRRFDDLSRQGQIMKGKQLDNFRKAVVLQLTKYYRFQRNLINRALKECQIPDRISDSICDVSEDLTRILKKHVTANGMELKLLETCRDMLQSNHEIASIDFDFTRNNNNNMIIIKRANAVSMILTCQEYEAVAYSVTEKVNQLSRRYKCFELHECYDQFDEMLTYEADDDSERLVNLLSFFNFCLGEKNVNFDDDLLHYKDVDHVSEHFFKTMEHKLSYQNENLIINCMELFESGEFAHEFFKFVKIIGNMFITQGDKQFLVSMTSKYQVTDTSWSLDVMEMIGRGSKLIIEQVYSLARTMTLFATYFSRVVSMESNFFDSQGVDDGYIGTLKKMTYSLFCLKTTLNQTAKRSLNKLHAFGSLESAYSRGCNFDLASLISYFNSGFYLDNATIFNCNQANSTFEKAIYAMIEDLIFYPTFVHNSSLPNLARFLIHHQEDELLLQFIHQLNQRNAILEFYHGTSCYNLKKYDQALESLLRVTPFIDEGDNESLNSSFFFGPSYEKQGIAARLSPGRRPLSTFFDVVLAAFQNKSPEFMVQIALSALDTCVHELDQHFSDYLWIEFLNQACASKLLRPAFMTLMELFDLEVRDRMLYNYLEIICKQREAKLIASLPFPPTLRNVVLSILEEKSQKEWTFEKNDLSKLTYNRLKFPNYTEILYTYYVSRADYRSAASLMYSSYESLQYVLLTLHNLRSDEYFQILHLQESVLSTCYTCLSVLDSDVHIMQVKTAASGNKRKRRHFEAFSGSERDSSSFERQNSFSSRPSDPFTELMADDTGHLEEHDLSYITINDINTTLDGIRARRSLMQDRGYTKSDEEMFETLREEGLYEIAVDFTVHSNAHRHDRYPNGVIQRHLKSSFTLMPIVRDLTTKLTHLQMNPYSTAQIRLETDKFGNFSFKNNGQADEREIYWRFLEYVCDQFDHRGNGYEYISTVCDTILSIHPDMELPHWIFEKMWKCARNSLVRIYIKNELLFEASELLYLQNRQHKDVPESSIPVDQQIEPTIKLQLLENMKDVIRALQAEDSEGYEDTEALEEKYAHCIACLTDIV